MHININHQLQGKLHLKEKLKHTVDGRNPAPVGRWIVPVWPQYVSCFLGAIITNCCRKLSIHCVHIPERIPKTSVGKTISSFPPHNFKRPSCVSTDAMDFGVPQGDYILIKQYGINLGEGSGQNKINLEHTKDTMGSNVLVLPASSNGHSGWGRTSLARSSSSAVFRVMMASVASPNRCRISEAVIHLRRPNRWFVVLDVTDMYNLDFFQSPAQLIQASKRTPFRVLPGQNQGKNCIKQGFL